MTSYYHMRFRNRTCGLSLPLSLCLTCCEFPSLSISSICAGSIRRLSAGNSLAGDKFYAFSYRVTKQQLLRSGVKTAPRGAESVVRQVGRQAGWQADRQVIHYLLVWLWLIWNPSRPVASFRGDFGVSVAAYITALNWQYSTVLTAFKHLHCCRNKCGRVSSMSS
jgi:hypothetical protein